jgi:rRNA maturation RNase YbeY
MPTAKENANKFNQAYEKEVARLIIHGVLHILDYSDKSRKEKQIMSKMEEDFLKETSWKALFEK